MQINTAHNSNEIIESIKREGGLRFKGINKKPQPHKPLVTIITATFNAAVHLPHTIKSIRELTYDNIQWIVVDGASKDSTVELIQQNDDVIDYWISEPDSGIYDAWNKGVSLAQGEWIAFVGAGDSYISNAIDIYMDVINASPTKLDLASSRVRLVDSYGLEKRVWGAAFNWRLFKSYMTIAHVGALHHKGLFEKFGFFDTSYTSAGDYEFLMRCGAHLNAIYLDVITSEMLIGGISNGYKGLFETYLIQRKYGVGFSAKPRFWLSCAKRFIRPLLRGY